jgi:pyruvate formate lyase activating enzyme
MLWTPAVLYRPSDDRVQCLVCPIGCRLLDGQTGSCHVRRRTGDSMQTATFASSVRHFDAVERKPLYHFFPGRPVLTLAAPGCTFRCSYCINHRMSQFGREDDVRWTADPVDPAEIVAAAAAAGACVGLSYTEPSLAIELTTALALHGSSAGVPVVWKTNGFMTEEAVAAALPSLSAVNIDIKAADEKAHRRLTGSPLGPVLETLRAFADYGIWVEVSTPVIPGVNAEQEQLQWIAERLAEISVDIPWHLLRWTPGFRLNDGDPTSPAALAEAVAIGRRAGLRYVYVERALGAMGRATCCPACGQVVVHRDVWALGSIDLYNGCCPGCGSRVAGCW